MSSNELSLTLLTKSHLLPPNFKADLGSKSHVFALKRHRVHVYEFVPNDKIHRNDDYVEGVPVPGNENHCNISFLILLHSKPCNPLMIIVTSF